MALGSRDRRALRRREFHRQVPASRLLPSGESASTIGAPVAVAEPEMDGSTPPVGTAKEILAWVSGDSDRAILALERELDSDSPRVTLVDNLYKIVK